MKSQELLFVVKDKQKLNNIKNKLFFIRKFAIPISRSFIANPLIEIIIMGISQLSSGLLENLNISRGKRQRQKM